MHMTTAKVLRCGCRLPDGLAHDHAIDGIARLQAHAVSEEVLKLAVEVFKDLRAEKKRYQPEAAADVIVVGSNVFRQPAHDDRIEHGSSCPEPRERYGGNDVPLEDLGDGEEEVALPRSLLEVGVFDLFGEYLHRVLIFEATIVLSCDGSLTSRFNKFMCPLEAQNFKQTALLAKARLVCNRWLLLRLLKLGLELGYLLLVVCLRGSEVDDCHCRLPVDGAAAALRGIRLLGALIMR